MHDFFTSRPLHISTTALRDPFTSRLGPILKSVSQSAPSIPYRPEIDGLRAVAVAVVVLFHAGVGCSGGYVGVDVFFVISGYLITSLILRDLESGVFRFGDFWERRIRRIAPALIAAVLVVFVAGWWLSLPDDFARLGQAIMAQVVCASNIIHWRMTGYFTPDAETLPLLHTWSLAVEEQFYLILPVALWLIRSWPKKSIRAAISVGCLVSFGIGIWATERHPAAAYFLLPSRAWELLLGSIIAVFPDGSQKVRRLVRELVSLAGLSGIMTAVFLFHAHTPFPGVAALLPTIGTAMFLWSNRSETTYCGCGLGWPPVVFIGKISYSLYLLHWPVIVFIQYWFRDEINGVWKTGLVAASVLGAVLSWRLVETPIRKKQWLASRGSLFAVVGMGTGLLFGMGLLIQQQQGLPLRFHDQTLNYALPQRDQRFQSNIRLENVQSGQLTPFGSTGGEVTCLVWGDSHAKALMPCIDEVCRQNGIRGEAALHVATAPLLSFVSRERYSHPDSPRYSAAVLNYARKHRVRVVILAALWRSYADEPGFAECVRQTVDRLTLSGIRVVIVRDVPFHLRDVPRLLARATLFGGDVHQIGLPLKQHRSMNKVPDDCFETLDGTNVTLVDPAPLLTDETGLCRAEMNGAALYVDSHHLSVQGSLRLLPLFSGALDATRGGTSKPHEESP